MDNHQKYNLLAILFLFLAFITLGGLGTAAVKSHFYWFPFIVNLGVYGYIIYKLFKLGQEK